MSGPTSLLDLQRDDYLKQTIIFMKRAMSNSSQNEMIVIGEACSDKSEFHLTTKKQL